MSGILSLLVVRVGPLVEAEAEGGGGRGGGGGGGGGVAASGRSNDAVGGGLKRRGAALPNPKHLILHASCNNCSRACFRHFARRF